MAFMTAGNDFLGTTLHKAYFVYVITKISKLAYFAFTCEIL